LILNINNDHRDNFVSLDALGQATGAANRGVLVMVAAEQRQGNDQEALIDALRNVYQARHVEATYFQSASQVRQENLATFDIITYLMLAMAILAAVVGSIGLASTMAINVIERGREIGVMRAVGATAPAVIGILVVEGVLIGVLSWLLSAPISYPAAQIFSRAIGAALLNTPLDFSFSLAGVALWLAAVTVLSMLASLWPALRATKVSIREALAYE
jgi:putative ABC transport system permease protein